MLRAFVKDSIVYGTSKVLSRAIVVLLVPVYTRYLSASDIGFVDLVAIVSVLLTYFVTLEIGQALARFYPEAEGKDQKIKVASTAVWFFVFGYGGATLVVALILFYLKPVLFADTRSLDTLFLALAGAVFTGFFLFVQDFLRWQLKPVKFAVSSIVYSVVFCGATIFYVVRLGMGVDGVFVGQATAGAVGVAMVVGFIRRELGLSFSRRILKEMVSFSAPLVLSSVSVFFMIYMDRLAIQHLLGMEQLGIYGIGYRFAAVVGLLLFGVQLSLTPLIYNYHKEPETPGKLAQILRIVVMLMWPVLLATGLFSPEILSVFATPTYYEAASVIPIIALGMILSRMYIFAPGPSIEKKTRLIAGINLLGSGLNIVLNYLLIPVMGILGAAVATALSGLFIFLLTMQQSQKMYRVPHNWLRIGVSTIVFAGFCAAGYVLTGSVTSLRLGTIAWKSAAVLGAFLVFLLLLSEKRELNSLLNALGLKGSGSKGVKGQG